MAPDDVVFYDDDGYPALRSFLKASGVRHVLLTGYATDMCFCLTAAGYKNVSPVRTDTTNQARAATAVYWQSGSRRTT